jgi:hypothetical protein
MIAAYIQQAMPTMFLTGFFQSPPQNFYNSEEIEIDIVRTEEEVSIVIQDISTGYRMNSEDIYTNKKLKAPIHKEAGPLNAFDLIKRMPGANPFEDPDFQANAVVRAFGIFRKTDAKIRRAIELQASQVLQTGTVTLIDQDGNSLFTVNYSPKATHFPTSATAWDQASDDKIGDLDSLANVIRGDGLGSPNKLIFGRTALNSFLADTAVNNQLDNRRIQRGDIASQMRGNGGVFHGVVWIGNYEFEIWSYTGKYKHPQTGVSTDFIDPAKVIMLSDNSRLDATFGAIPRIVPPDARVLPFLPPRISDSAVGIDMFTNAWVSDDGEQLFVGSGSRPLMIPTAIDTYGCLDTGL